MVIDVNNCEFPTKPAASVPCSAQCKTGSDSKVKWNERESCKKTVCFALHWHTEKILRLVSQGEDAEKQESFSLSLNHLPPLNSLLLWWQIFPKPCSVKLVKYSTVPGPEGGCNNSDQISPTKEHIWGHCRLEMFLKSIWNEKGGEEVNRAEQRGENWRQKAFWGKYVSALPLLPLGLSHSANCLCRWLTLKL